MNRKKFLWIIPAMAIVILILWQSGAINYFLARTIFAPDHDEETFETEREEPPEDMDRERTLAGGEYDIEVIAENLEIPWELVHLPDGEILVTERPGRVILLDGEEVETLHTVEHVGEGGLLGMALSPEFEQDGYLYLYYTYREGGGLYNRVARYLYDPEGLGEEEVVLDGIPGDRIHNGGRIRFGPDGLLYIATGDAADPPLAQDPESLGGMILRVAPDGEIPEDNPMEGSPVYAYGIRNPQGLAWHPKTEELYISGHGPTRMDVINHIIPGANYGWPEITCDEDPQDYEQALICYEDFTLAPSGMDFYYREELEEIPLFVSGLRGNMVMRIDFTPEGEVIRQEPLFQDYGRIRTVVYHEGSIYIATNNQDGRGTPAAEDDRIFRITPVIE